MCTYIYISVHICAYKYNIGIDMYTCVYMYTHIRQDKYLYIMIHTYVYIYIRVGSVCAYEQGKGYVLRVVTHTI